MPRVIDDVEDALDAGAVEVGGEPDELLGALARHDSAGPAGVEQDVDPLTGGPQASSDASGSTIVA